MQHVANLRPDIIIERAGHVYLAGIVRVSWATNRAFGDAAKSTLEVAADDQKCGQYEPLASEIRHWGEVARAARIEAQ